MDPQTIDTYNKIAEAYDDETINFWKSFSRTFINKFVELSGNKIINIGSGPGRDSQLLQQAGKEVVCVDASEAMIKLSSARGLESVLAEFDRLPFKNESFDAAWSYTALLHVPKQAISTSLKEIFRVLKPSGIFALGLIEGDTEEYRTSHYDMPRWFSYYQKDEVVNLCTQHHFDLVYFEICKPGSRNYLNFIFRKL
jgi:ubiquinone/menaquinone biosynthesis C-methylase UbiE